MDLAIIVAIDFVYAIATLALISLGLAIVFGMMRIINLAHGEFMVMGSYSASVAVHHRHQHLDFDSDHSADHSRHHRRHHRTRDRTPTVRPHGGDHAGDLGLESVRRRRADDDLRRHHRGCSRTPLPGITIGALSNQRLQPVCHRLVGCDYGRGLRDSALEPARAPCTRRPCKTPIWRRRSAPTPRASMPLHLRSAPHSPVSPAARWRRFPGSSRRYRRLLYRPRLHNRHRRRRGTAGRHRYRRRRCSASSTRSPRFCNPVYGEVALLLVRDRSDSRIAAGHYRPLFPEKLYDSCSRVRRIGNLSQSAWSASGF